MASSTVTVQDGALAAVASGNGRNATVGSVQTVTLTDTSGVTGWQLRSIWNNQGLNDATLSAGFTVNSSTGVATIPSQPAGTAMILSSEILGSTLIPSVPRTFFALYWRPQGAVSVAFSAIPSPLSLQALINFMSTPAFLPANTGNWVACNNVSTIVVPAAPANYFFAAGLLQVQQTGIFRVDVGIGWADSATGDTVTFALVTDTSAAGQLATAGTKAAVGIAGYGVLAGLGGSDLEIMTAGATGLTYNGAAFTTAPIVQKVEAQPTLTGLLTGSAQKFIYSGIVHNAIGAVRTPFLLGNTVAFGIKVSATNTVTIPEFNFYIKELEG